MKQLDRFLKRAMTLLASRVFFRYIVGLLVIEAAWIACTNRFPMAFDEDYHFGLIKIYAQHLSPFLTGQPDGADTFGAIARDPSYLYQYLMSFPYRFLRLFTDSQSALVIMLRFINIALFSWGLLLIRRVLDKLRAPAGVINGSLLVFVLIPVVPLLAGQINYDNLFIPLIALNFLLTIKLVDGLRARRIDVVSLLELSIVCLLTSLVKYAFLPVFVGLGLYLLLQLIRFIKPDHSEVWQTLRDSVQKTKRWQIAGLTLLLVVVAGLFSQRYLVNVAHYGTPLPACDKVLSIEQCSHYGPWNRDYNLALTKVDTPHSVVGYIDDWLHGMWLRLYFTLDGPASNYQTRSPFPVPSLSGAAIAVGGLVGLALGFRKLLRQYDASVVVLLLGISLLYAAMLFMNNYAAYARTGQAVAVNGRYLLPFLPYVMVLCTLAWRTYLMSRRRFASVFVLLVIATQLWGGGALTFILRSNNVWYWNNSLVRTANHAVKASLGPITPGYHRPTQFLH